MESPTGPSGGVDAPCRPLALAALAMLGMLGMLAATAAAGSSGGDASSRLSVIDAKGVTAPLELDRAGLIPEGPYVARIHYSDPREIRRLDRFDLLEYRDRTQQYVLVLADPDELRELLALGFELLIDRERTDDVRRARSALAGQRAGIPGYPCYRTVEETFATAQQLVADHPDLATVVDAGDSWEKTAGIGGYDLLVLRLTRSGANVPRPKLIVTCSIHAREYAPAELCTRFAEHLVDGYGVDADATWLLDHHEIHLLLQANPDGRKRAETGLSWRKNTNQNYCGPTSSSRGADLNRNFEFEWGCCGGSSGSECDTLYRGPAPASEPEVQTVQAYLRSQFPDQRDQPLDAPAPSTATGLYLDMHSSGRQLLWPWGFGGAAPNGSQLQTLGRKLAYFNGYTPEQAVELYPADGTTIDFAYGDLGVAACAYELGTSFFQSCETFESTIVQENLRSLTYAAKIARTPYITPAGPDGRDLLVTPVLADAGTTRVLSAIIDDTRFGNGNGTEPSQPIVAAEMYVDELPWKPGSTAIPLAPSDGSFDGAVESVAAVLATSGLEAGRHAVHVRGRDADGNWGAVTGRFFYVTDGTEGSAAGTVTDADTGSPLAAAVSVPALGLTTATDPATGAYSLTLPAGSWTLRAVAAEHLPETVDGVLVAAGETTAVDFALAPAPALLLVDDDDNGPDVRSHYTEALDALGESYFVWDTGNSDFEPDPDTLAVFGQVIWFTGDEYGGSAGPGGTSEGALTGWLDRSRCLLIASQEYYWDRGLTAFMQQRLGVAGVANDVGQSTVEGQGSVFGGLGPYSLSFPYSNYTDAVDPDGSAEVAFSGSVGSAGVNKDTGLYRTSYWGFGLETLPDAAARAAALGRFLNWCGSLPDADGDSDGVTNGEDCAPADLSVWSPPAAATELRLAREAEENLSWAAPLQPGSISLRFDLLRSTDPSDFHAAVCRAAGTTSTVATDAVEPPPGGLYVYLVRPVNDCGEALGNDSSGEPRSGGACF